MSLREIIRTDFPIKPDYPNENVEARRLYREKGWSPRGIAKRYGWTKAKVDRVLRGEE